MEPHALTRALRPVGEAGIEHVHPDVASGDQGIGAGEEEQRRVPEANEIAHERLLVGER